MDFGCVCRPSGDVLSSAAAGRRGASGLPFSCRASTPGPERPDGEPSYRFPRSHRLTRGADLQAVRREGKRIRTEHLDVRASASLLHHPRVGIIIPKHKHSSVDRNRLKRRLRELVRTRLLPELPAVDVVIRSLPDAYGATFAGLTRQLARVGDRVRQSFPVEFGPPGAGTPERGEREAGSGEER